MKLLRFGPDLTGVLLDGERILDIGAHASAFTTAQPSWAPAVARLLPVGPAASWVPMIDGWDEARGLLDAMVEWAEDRGVEVSALSDVRLRAPVAAPTAAYFTLAANFVDHLVRAGSMMTGTQLVHEEVAGRLTAAKAAGAPPTGAVIHPRVLIDPEATACLPEGTALLDYEGEVMAMLRATASGPVIWGVTGFNDLSIRGTLFDVGPRADEIFVGGRHGITWAMSKNFAASKPVGPWVAVDELSTDDLRWRVRVNGEERQCMWARDMVYGFGDAIDHISQFFSLCSGDGIVSGTGAGTAMEDGVDGPFLVEGDVVEVDIEGLGVLRTFVGPSRPA